MDTYDLMFNAFLLPAALAMIVVLFLLIIIVNED